MRARRMLITSLVTERNFNTSELWFGAFMALLCSKLSYEYTTHSHTHKTKLKDKKMKDQKKKRPATNEHKKGGR